MSDVKVRTAAAGLAREDFVRIGRNGIGDKLNAYPHSMAWFRDKLFLGTTRSNLCMLKTSTITRNVDIWPVDCPENQYTQDMRAQILTYDPQHKGTGENAGWKRIARAPWIYPKGEKLPKELGYRGMCVFQGKNDTTDHLYIATYAPLRGYGTRVLRTADGKEFEDIKLPDAFDRTILTLRLIVPFKGWLFTSPTGSGRANPNTAGHALVFATQDPMAGDWHLVNPPGFGDPANVGIFEMHACGDYLYAGTANMFGYQIWRTRAEGPPPFNWEPVVRHGAYRGRLNQGVASFVVHDGLLYAGSGIQHGGIDVANGVGPAGPELIRIHPDGTWDLIVGNSRATPDGYKVALSGYRPGFDSVFNGYFWRMASHDGWIYLGTFDWSRMMRYADTSKWPGPFRRMVERVGLERVVEMQAGADLYRSRDGENWLPVTTNGFDNSYNHGIRTMQSTPFGLAVGMVNPFGPRVGTWTDGKFGYKDNPDGGLEIWFGSKGQDP